MKKEKKSDEPIILDSKPNEGKEAEVKPVFLSTHNSLPVKKKKKILPTRDLPQHLENYHGAKENE